MKPITNNPRDHGIPHDEYRPTQHKAIEQVFSLFEEGNKNPKTVVVAQVPTGVGKSVIPTALGEEEPVLVLVHTLGLLAQYQDRYNFEVVMGMQEYPCVFPPRVNKYRARFNRIPTAAECTFGKMSDCPAYEECPYIVARNKAMRAKRMACTYRYAALNPMLSQRLGTIVFDEAHSSADEILQMQEIQITQVDLDNFNLPPIPFKTNFGLKGEGDFLDQKAKAILVPWLNLCADKLAKKVLEEENSSLSEVESVQAIRSAARKFSTLSTSIQEKDIWFLQAGPTAIDWYGRYHGAFVNHGIPGIRVRPLTASEIARKVTAGKSRVLLMSATIGDPGPLTTELGMLDYSFLDFDHPTPPAYRPIFDLGVPKMIAANLSLDPDLPRKQAQAITKFVVRWPKSWRGLILSNSISKIAALRQHLIAPLGDRLLDATTITDMETWLASKVPGAVAINTIQGWGHGIDLHHDLARWVVMGGVPFKNPTDRYQAVKQIFNGTNDYFWYSCYLAVCQAVGRVSRGEINPDGTWMFNAAAIADGSATTGAAMRFYPRWFKEALVKGAP